MQSHLDIKGASSTLGQLQGLEEEAKKTFEYLQQIGELEELGPEGEATG